jgi:Spy/CpxP family protein refolding chaperone
MNRKRLLIVAVAAVVLLAGAGLGLAEYMGHGGMRKLLGTVLTPGQMNALKDFRQAHRQERMKGRGEHQAEFDAARAKLQLTNDQEDKLLNLVGNNEDKIMEGVEPLLADGQAIREALTAPTPDPAKLQAVAATLGDDLGDLGVLAAGLIKQGRAVLTPEQNAALDTLHRLRAEQARQRLAQMPARANDLLGLWKQVNLSAAQIQGLANLAGPAMSLMETRHRFHADKHEARLSEVLSADQMNTLKAHKDELGPGRRDHKRADLEEAAALIQKLNLSQDQLDRLTALVNDRQAALQPALQKVVEAGFGLREQVMAATPDEAAIRKSASAVGDAVAQALPLYADAIGASRKVLSPDQTAAINDFVIVREGRIDDFVLGLPTRFEELMQLREDLNLTPEQKQAMRELHRERMHHHVEGHED